MLIKAGLPVFSSSTVDFMTVDVCGSKVVSTEIKKR